MANEIAIPEHLKKYLANPGTSTDADAMASASISIPRISLRGRKFRPTVGGEEIRRPADDILVVILAVEPGAGLMQKTYYKSGYVPGDNSPPDCSSGSGLHPDSWISNPVARSCRDCPMNAFGSATSNQGKKTKACKDSKRLWVAFPEDMEGTVFALGVPVTSLKAMAEYGQLMKTNGIPISAVLTKISMKDAEFPELVFEFAGVLSEDTMAISMRRNEQKDWSMLTSGPMLEGPKEPIEAPGAKQLVQQIKEPVGQVDPDAAAGNW